MAGFWQRLKRLFRGSSARGDERDSHLPLALESAGKEADKTEGERKVYESSGVVILEDPTLADSQDQDASTDSAQASPAKEKTATPAEVASSESAEQSEPAAATPERARRRAGGTPTLPLPRRQNLLLPKRRKQFQSPNRSRQLPPARPSKQTRRKPRLNQ